MAGGAQIKQDDRFVSIAYTVDFVLHPARDAHLAVADLRRAYLPRACSRGHRTSAIPDTAETSLCMMIDLCCAIYRCI